MKQKIVNIILNDIECEGVVLFGSYASEAQNTESDIDIAIKPKKTHYKKWRRYLWEMKRS